MIPTQGHGPIVSWAPGLGGLMSSTFLQLADSELGCILPGGMRLCLLDEDTHILGLPMEEPHCLLLRTIHDDS